MNSIQTRNTVYQIKTLAQVHMGILLIEAIFIFGLCYLYYGISYSVKAAATTANAAHAQALKNAVNIAANEKIIINFMEQSVQRWDKLSKDNPKMVVPAASTKPKSSPLTESELTRGPTPKPTPTPTPTPVKPKVIIKYVKPKPKPLWERVFGK